MVERSGPRIFFALAGLVCAGLAVSTALQAAERWLLMSRHGECAPIQVLERKVPALGEVSDPEAFVRSMRQRGYEATLNRFSVPRGKAYEIKVPEKGLFLIFVTSEMCDGRDRR